MKSMIQTAARVAVAALIIAGLTGCWNSRELNTLAIVLGVGLDAGSAPGEVEITAQIVKTQGLKGSNSSGPSEDEAYVNLSNIGTGTFDTIREFTHRSSRKLYFPHNQIIVIGEDLAGKGVRDALDMLSRNHETRMNVYILVAKGSAKDVLNMKPSFGQVTASEISQLVEAQKATSYTPTTSFFEVTGSLTSKTSSFVAPIIRVGDSQGEKDLILSGCAVFNKDKMVGELNQKETRGLLWIRGDVGSGIITVGILEVSAELEIVRASSQITPEIGEDGSVKIRIKITEESDFGSQTGSVNVLTKENIELLKKAQAEEIKKEIEMVLEKAMSLNADIFGFGQAVYRKYPRQWETMESEWNVLFPSLEVEVEVETKIKSVGRINRPNYPSEG